jgi:hypothetical protein
LTTWVRRGRHPDGLAGTAGCPMAGPTEPARSARRRAHHQRASVDPNVRTVYLAYAAPARSAFIDRLYLPRA